VPGARELLRAAGWMEGVENPFSDIDVESGGRS